LFAFFFLSLNSTLFAADSSLYIGALPIPGTNKVSTSLTLAQHGVILENDQISLNWQEDGNLVLYFYGKEPLWATNTEGKGSVLTFDANDHELQVKNSSGSIIWRSNTTNANLLKLQSDRNLVILNSSNQTVWQSGTTIHYLTDDGAAYSIGSSGSKAQDVAIPLNTSYKYIYVRTEGADGGARRIYDSGTLRFKVGGGEGASVLGTFAIGTGTNQIPPGSTIRLIIGLKGENRTVQTTAGCTGGGGTGILFKKPNDDNWHLLMAAGGGGGAYSDCCSVKREGHAGLAGENGDRGGGSGGSGGIDGSYGKSGGSSSYIGTGGGGAYEGELWGNNGAPGWDSARVKNSNGTYTWHTNVLPQGGRGGRGSEDSNMAGTQTGPWGFGGGGGANSSGGGGGGYSGGGAGGNYYPGGGGGSYIDAAFASLVTKNQNESTTSPGDGFVNYKFFNNTSELFQKIRIAYDTDKCVDINGAGSTYDDGTNVQIWDCVDRNSQDWNIEGSMIHPSQNPNKCLDLSNSNTNDGTNIQIFRCNASRAQFWVYDGITKNIRSGINFNKCLDLVNANVTNGTNIQLWDCKNIAAQRWNIDGATNPVISSTYNRIHFALDTDKCIDVQSASTENGANVQIYHCHYAESQYWYFDGNTIRFNKDHNKCLDVTNSNSDNGTNIQLWDCDDTDPQHWTYDGISRSFRSYVNGGKCLDVDHSGTADHTNIQLYDCNGTDAQQFEIGN